MPDNRKREWEDGGIRYTAVKTSTEDKNPAAAGMMRALGKRIKVKPSENSPRGRAFADEETRLRQRQIDVEGEIQRENDEYKRKRAAILRRFGEKEE